MTPEYFLAAVKTGNQALLSRLTFDVPSTHPPLVHMTAQNTKTAWEGGGTGRCVGDKREALAGQWGGGQTGRSEKQTVKRLSQGSRAADRSSERRPRGGRPKKNVIP